VSTLAAIVPLLAAADAAEEGQKVITAMLIVGLVFVGVIVLGELTSYVFHRRRD
jgi:heme/copper-type cytochrome/quinol oxidase subunit 2